MSNQTTPITVSNEALTLIGGEGRIASFTDGTKEAILCSSNYDQTRMELLRKYRWKFAKIGIQLSPDAAEYPVALPDGLSAGGGQTSYTLPGDCISVHQVNDVDSEWKIVGRKIVCNYPSIVLWYTGDITDCSLFDPLFTYALACGLASKIAYSMTQSADVQKMVDTKLPEAIRSARQASSIEQSPERMVADYFDNVRIGPNRGFVRDPMT